jgi:serine/threonine-protein kinase
VIAALIAVIVLIVAVSGITGYLLLAGWRTSQPSTTAPPPTALPPSTTSTPTVTPVAEAALEGLLLSPGQINTAMGVTGMTVSGPKRPTSMYTDTDVPDKACLHLDNAKEAAVYGGSGWTSVYGQELDDPLKWPHRVNQAVVLFSSAHDADAFFSASAQSWPACSNRQFTETEPEPDVVFTVGPVSNANSTLSATTTRTADGWTCHRALTVANNVAIDVGVCGYNKSDFQSYSAINIAQQIAAKVPT